MIRMGQILLKNIVKEMKIMDNNWSMELHSTNNNKIY